MKKAMLLLTTLLSINVSILSAATEEKDSLDVAGVGVEVVSSEDSLQRPLASATDLEKIRGHILGYTTKLGLPSEVETVGSVGCCAFLSTTFDSAQKFLLNELAGQVLARLLAVTLDDLADGHLDGIAYGKKINYAREIGALLGVSVSEEELHAAPVGVSLVSRLTGFAVAIVSMIQEHGLQKDALMDAMGAFAKKKMDKARKSLAVALVRESDRIIALELGNGKVDGLDAHGVAIDWKAEMQRSVKSAMEQVMGAVL